MRRGPKCSVCQRPDRAAIDEILIGGYASGATAYRDFDIKYSTKPDIAQRFNIPKDTIGNHGKACLGLTMNKYIVDAARKRSQRNLERKLTTIAARAISLATPAAVLRLHEERYSDVDMIFQEARAVGDTRIALAADKARGEIAGDAARLQGFEKTGSPLIDVHVQVIQQRLATMSDERLADVIDGGPTIEGKTVEHALTGEVAA